MSLTASELYEGSLAVLLGKYDAKRGILFLLSVAFLGGMIWTLFFRSENATLAGFAPWLGWVLFPALIGGLMVGLPYYQARSEVRRNPNILGPADYFFSEHEVEINAPFGCSELFWTAFERILETKVFFLLYIGRNRACVLPKRCFSSRAEIVEFRELLQQVYRGKLELRSS